MKIVKLNFYGKVITLKYQDHSLYITWSYIKKPIVLKQTDDSCFECISHSLTHNGYPKITFLNKTVRLNRFMYCLFHQISFEKIKGYLMCHYCDNRLCVNPEHLVKETHKFNMRDMCEKGRQIRGEKHHKTRLTEVDILYIKDSDMSTKYFALTFGVTEQTIRNIRKGITWKNV